MGEHVFGDKLTRLLDDYFQIRDIGLPTGSDLRLVLSNEKISEITKGFTKYCWLFADIKSVGPRDDQDHTVMSHNQITGSGEWDHIDGGVKNATMQARGHRITHPFYCSIPPIYVLSDGSIVPVVLIVIKPVYKMLILDDPQSEGGQPLGRITIAAIPNGLLLEKNPGYLTKYPSLFFPGKDDKGKNPLKVRGRVSFSILRKIADWRVRDIDIPN